MENLKKQLIKLVELMGFSKFQVVVDMETKVFSVNIDGEENIAASKLPDFVLNINRIMRLMAKRENIYPIVVDINNYRRERERLIIELAKAAARKVVATKEPVRLPTMNAYERRLIHAELSMRPDVTTESVGEAKDRCVVVKVINLD